MGKEPVMSQRTARPGPGRRTPVPRRKESLNPSCCLVAQYYSTLPDPMDCSPPGSSVHGISQARMQEYWSGLPFPSPGDLPNPKIQPASPALAGRFFYLSHQGSQITHKKGNLGAGSPATWGHCPLPSGLVKQLG